jgi:hypothetical protein
MPEEQSDQDASVRRGAWYADPYGTAEQQRWYYGTKWTREVRLRPADEEPPGVRIVGPPQRQEDEEWGWGEGQPAFGVSMPDVVGEQLRLETPGPKRWYEFELLSTRGRLARLSLLWKTQLASLACAEGSWSLTKPRRFGWQLPIRGSEGDLVGDYLGR